MASPSSDATVECDICCEDFQRKEVTLVDDDKLCAACFDTNVKVLFDRALKYEMGFPPVWATVTLRLEDFEDRFSDDFVSLWRERQAEMEVSRSGAIRDTDAFVGMTCGKDYQWCPGCDAPVMLSDGCNTIVCARNSCRQHFCFICGVKAHHDSNHWQEGSTCPRWLQPDAPRASYDLLPAAQPPQADDHEEMMVDIQEALENAEAAIDSVHRFYWQTKADLMKIGLRAWWRVAADKDEREHEVIQTLDLLFKANEVVYWLWTEELDPVQLCEGWQALRQAFFAAKYAKDWILTDVLQQYPDLGNLFEEFFPMAKHLFMMMERLSNEVLGVAADRAVW